METRNGDFLVTKDTTNRGRNAGYLTVCIMSLMVAYLQYLALEKIQFYITYPWFISCFFSLILSESFKVVFKYFTVLFKRIEMLPSLSGKKERRARGGVEWGGVWVV